MSDDYTEKVLNVIDGLENLPAGPGYHVFLIRDIETISDAKKLLEELITLHKKRDTNIEDQQAEIERLRMSARGSLVAINTLCAEIDRLREAAEVGLKYAEEALLQKERDFQGHLSQYELEQHRVSKIRAALGKEVQDGSQSQQEGEPQ